MILFKVFNMLDRPDKAAWGGMMSAFVREGYDCEAYDHSTC